MSTNIQLSYVLGPSGCQAGTICAHSQERPAAV